MKLEPGAGSFFLSFCFIYIRETAGRAPEFFSPRFFLNATVYVECEGKKRGGSFAVKILRELEQNGPQIYFSIFQAFFSGNA